MSLLQINEALPLAEPLLEQQSEQKNEHEHKTVSIEGEWKSRTKFVVLGAITGFFIQIVSLGAYACLLINFNGMSLAESGTMSMDGFFQPIIGDNKAVDTANEGQYFGKDALVYTLLSVLTQVDLIVYVLIWVGFTCTMTRNGMRCIRSQFFSSSSSSSSSSSKHSNSADQNRYVFVLGVSFLVGIVIGAFGAWFAIDVYLDFPIPLQPIVVTVVVDLALCYMMVMCFDMGGSFKSKTAQQRSKYCCDEEEIDVDTEDEETAPVCC